jgi:hypothetical protein
MNDEASIAEMVMHRHGAELVNGGLDRVMTRVRQAVGQTGEVSDAQLTSIVDEVLAGSEVFQGVADTFR